MGKQAEVIPLRPPPDRRERLRALVEPAAAGDAAAADRLLREVAPAVLKVIRGMLGPHNPDVDDVLQDALLRLLHALPRYRGECTVIHFAVRIGVRAAADSARRHERRTRLKDAYGVERRGEPATAPLSALEERELLGWLLTETLSPPQIEALLLRNAMGYRIDEIAEAVGAPVNTVRSRLGAAKRALRERLEADPELAQLFGRGR